MTQDPRLQAIHDILSREKDDTQALAQIRGVVYAEDAAPAAAPPIPPVMDKGLTSWVTMIHNHLASQPGIEMLPSLGATVNYRFRGQNFMVIVEAV